MLRVLRRQWGALALAAIAALSPCYASADAVIAANSAILSCQPAGTCVEVPVVITGIPRPLGFTGVRGVHVNLKIEGNIQLCTDPVGTNFTQGEFLPLSGGTTTGLVISTDPVSGIITVDQAITGDPPCRDAEAGQLFVLTVKSIAATGNGTITVTEVTVRDCGNAPIAAAPGAPATIAFNGATGQPLQLHLTSVPSTIWPPDGALHDIHIDATTTGGCGSVSILLQKIEARCEHEEGDDDHGDNDFVGFTFGHEPLPGDVVDADFGQPDFDFKLRARQCGEDKDDLILKHGHDDDCEGKCRDDCEHRCEDKFDYRCDRIADSSKRHECEDEQREAREKCEKDCEDDCDHDCEREQTLVYRITYTATDSQDSTVSARTTVRVQQSTVVHATAALSSGAGHGQDAPSADAEITSLDVTIPTTPQLEASTGAQGEVARDRSAGGAVDIPRTGGLARLVPKFDAGSIDRSQVFVGNAYGLVAASELIVMDVDHDGLDDVVARFEKDHLRIVHDLSSRPGAQINLYFRDVRGNGYTAPNLLGDAWTWPEPAAPRPDPRRDPMALALIPAHGVTRLEPIYPNPARGAASFVLELATAGEAQIEVFDLRGARVRTMMSGLQPAGRQVLKWDGLDDEGRTVQNGMYLVRARAGNFRATRSTVFIR